MGPKLEPVQLEQLEIAAARLFRAAKEDGRNISRRKAYDQIAMEQGFSNWALLKRATCQREETPSIEKTEHAPLTQEEISRLRELLKPWIIQSILQYLTIHPTQHIEYLAAFASFLRGGEPISAEEFQRRFPWAERGCHPSRKTATLGGRYAK
ncbi:hypothetical protein [Herbaspirillum robiniae]|uniref:hypothetical protein n=1 Tax=Herbaspirillum robiniae TaxID=2014887 RepID=UPI0011E4CD3F|nr:hypothetical protein [Herbaspirillum robiniae]